MFALAGRFVVSKFVSLPAPASKIVNALEDTINPADQPASARDQQKQNHVIEPDWRAKPAPLRHSWKRIANIDQFRWLSRADVLEHLKMARDEFGITHVRAAGMYSPEMRVWERKLSHWKQRNAQPCPNWQYVDLNLESLLQLGLKPVYTTCFTPRGMTTGTKTCWPDGNPVSMPDDLDEWSRFVADGVSHHIKRYGAEEVGSWLFECWNEPNLAGFFDGTREDFFRLWSATWRAVKSVDSTLRLGGPSTARGEWIGEFLDFCDLDGTPPDYLITHIYNNDSESEPLSPFDGPASARVKDSPDFAAGVIRGTRRMLDERGWKGEVHWNEWGRSWFPYDLRKETALEPAFIVKTMCEVSQEADEFAFWCLSDIYDQCGRQSSEFDGNYGMLSLHGLRKQSWFAHQLLGMLGKMRVPVVGQSESFGALATWCEGKPAVIFWAFPKHPEEPTSEIQIEVGWTNHAATLYRLDESENNVILDWKRAGSPAYPNPAEIQALRKSNTLTPAAASELARCPGAPRLAFSMKCPGVALLSAQ